jgi:hypothetical protein
MADITKAILNINPNAEVVIVGQDIDTCTINWYNNTPEISKADIKAKISQLAYIDKRVAAYPNTNEFIEAYTEKEIGGDSTKWDAYVINYNEVRTENPK